MRRPLRRFATAFLTFLLVAALATPTGSTAQQAGAPIVIGERVTLHSDVLGEDRALLVYRPDGYEQSETRYPVLYLLDGDAHFHHTTGLIDFLARNGRMPQMLVVALPNTARTRDLTPALGTPDERFPTAGGADAFLAFLTDELMPYVEAHFRTQPYRVLVGHSFGGLFAVHALLTRPDAFDAYVAISPSLWWDEQAPLKRAEAFFDAHPDVQRFLYLSLGNEGGNMLTAAQGFIEILEQKAPAGLAWRFAMMEQEDHGSIPHRTTYDALEMLYADWQLPQQIARTGTLDDFDRHFAALSQRFGYEIITPENDVNQLGYRLLGEKKIDEAIAVFRRNVEVYPASANVYDSLGDGLDAAGHLEEAREHYALACEKGQAANHPGTPTYCGNLARVSKKISGM